MQFVEMEHLNIWIGSWNVNGRYTAESLSGWLIPNEKAMPDIFVLGLQEMDLSAEAYIVTDPTREDEWTDSCFLDLDKIRRDIGKSRQSN